MSKEKTLKDWCKDWDFDTILANATSDGMALMADRITEKELLENRRILVAELERRNNK